MVQEARKNGSKIVTTNGCFDILHIGHVRYLSWAKKQGNVLIVGINSDASVRALKGHGRPVTPERERAEIIASLKCVDAAFIFSEETPITWIKKIKPEIHVKGADRSLDQIIEKEIVEKNGGKVLRAPYLKGRSTTKVLENVRSQSKPLA